PIRISACRILPSGPTARATSSAPRPFLYQSIACAALSHASCGVTVWCPGGTGLFALAMVKLLPPKTRESCIVIGRRRDVQADEQPALLCGRLRQLRR